jgi:hypothetical protein
LEKFCLMRCSAPADRKAVRIKNLWQGLPVRGGGVNLKSVF